MRAKNIDAVYRDAHKLNSQINQLWPFLEFIQK
jgi:hypothetical protein